MAQNNMAFSESKPLIDVTLAILYQEGQFLMQLRDDFSHIVHPGVWGFFGGHIEPGEAPDSGIRRELMEELAYMPPVLELFFAQSGNRADPQGNYRVRRSFYHGELTVPISSLVLGEGQDLALCSETEIRAGQKYSVKLDEVRPLGQSHQRALLDFMDSGLMYSVSVSSEKA